MRNNIYLLIAILSAIPTFGISLLIYFIFKRINEVYIIKHLLLKGIITSYKTGEKISIPMVSDSTIHHLFDYTNGIITSQLNNYTKGYLIHPLNNLTLSVFINKTKKNKIELKVNESQIKLDSIVSYHL